MSYTTTEIALKDLIVANMSGYTNNNTKCGEADSAFAYAIKNNTNVCLLDFAGGQDDGQPDRLFQDELWIWNCQVTFFLQYNKDTIETDIRSLVDAFLVLRRDNKRLSTNAVWKVTSSRAFQILKRNDRPFVPMIFAVAFKAPI